MKKLTKIADEVEEGLNLLRAELREERRLREAAESERDEWKRDSDRWADMVRILGNKLREKSGIKTSELDIADLRSRLQVRDSEGVSVITRDINPATVLFLELGKALGIDVLVLVDHLEAVNDKSH